MSLLYCILTNENINGFIIFSDPNITCELEDNRVKITTEVIITGILDIHSSYSIREQINKIVNMLCIVDYGDGKDELTFAKALDLHVLSYRYNHT